MRTKLWTIGFGLVLAALWVGPALAGPGASKPDPWVNFKAEKALDGWTEVSPGVLERKLGQGKVEHLGLGREGLTWLISDLDRKLVALQKLYLKNPSVELDRAINELIAVMTGAHAQLRTMPSGTATALRNLIGTSCSSICYSATADAYPLTSTQGVGAIANATFNSSCGFSGETYAFARSQATAGTTTTIVTQQDVKTGNPINSSASASVNGGSISGLPCFSEASSYALSADLGIAYFVNDSNYDCPVPATPLGVYVSGTSYEYFSQYDGCRVASWTAVASGGSGTYTNYQWSRNGAYVGSGSTFTEWLCPMNGSLDLAVTVTDSAGANKTAFHTVWLELETTGCYFRFCELEP